MISSWTLLLVSASYAAVLFAVAWWGNRHPLYSTQTWLRPVIYSLALAVYCSSWVFYGSVGTAVREGLDYLPILLGPLLLLILGWRIIERLVLISRSEHIASTADFISSRFGRSRRLAALVTLIALLGMIPYLALQYKAVAMSLEVLTGYNAEHEKLASMLDPALALALLMALFATLFGTREVDTTEHRHGVMLAAALGSVVKFVAIVTVALFACYWLFSGEVSVVASVQALAHNTSPDNFIAQTLLAFTALFCLPWQFYVGVVECNKVGDVRKARWLFGGYLVVMALVVIPIAMLGVSVFSGGSGLLADGYVVGLPLAQGQKMLAVLAYVGGFSAAMGVMIVASITLATMVSNDLVMPLLLRFGKERSVGMLAAVHVLWVRRVVILLLALLAYGYYRMSGAEVPLASYGLLALVVMAQFAPGLIAGLYWRGASRAGVEVGMLLGVCMWGYTLLLPALTRAGWFAGGWLEVGPWGLGWLQPEHLFGFVAWDGLTHGLIWSLLVNIGALVLISIRWRPGLDELLRTAPFVDPYAERPMVAGEWPGDVRVGDLQLLVQRLVGSRYANRVFAAHAEVLGRELRGQDMADRAWVLFTEKVLGASIGIASARQVLTSVLRGTGMDMAAVVSVLNETGQELRFNREVLSTTLENISAGVSVVDPQMQLVAWNRSYQKMFDYPDGMLFVGRPVADLIRYNAERGEFGDVDVDVEEHVSKRIGYMQAGSKHVFERVRVDGQVIEMRGQPLPGGGYVTSYSDITDYKQVEQELREVNETLEQRVAERSQAAESAQQSKTRFLAAISHDVLQPLNAARLFASALRECDEAGQQRYLAERVDTSLRAAEELLDGLLDVSRLDTGTLQVDVEVFDVGVLLGELSSQYAPVAAGRNLRLDVRGSGLWVRSDRLLLRRVLQNFIANALRYTRQGRILLAARKRGGEVELQIWDTGLGVPEHHMQQIFMEFHRYEQPFDWGEQGLGLGLSICQRISSLLGHGLKARSRLGHGSMFSITVPGETPRRRHSDIVVKPVPRSTLAGMRVLCVDNDYEILDGMQALLGRWEAEVVVASTVDEALRKIVDDGRFDVMLVDYHLHDRLDGLDMLDALQKASVEPLAGALLTADGRDELKQEARQRGYRLLTKPVKPASLRAFLEAHHSPLVEG